MRSLLQELEGKKHIIWDWNGTLLHDIEHNVQTVNALLKSAGLPAITTVEHREIFRFPVIEYYRHLGFDISPENFLRLCDEFNDLYNAGLDQCDVLPELRQVVLTLHHKGIAQSVLSASRQDALKTAIARFGLADIFQFIHGISDNTASSKLSRGQELIELTHITPKDTVLIGDTDHDLEVGKALDVDVILVAHGHQSYERLCALHAKVIELV